MDKFITCFVLIFSILHLIVIVTVNPPQNVIISQESSNSLQVTWDHPCDGPPAIHYLITYICVQFGTAFSTNQEQSLTVPKENTSTIIENLPLTVGNVYIVAVTSVFNNVSTASKQVPIEIGNLMNMHSSIATNFNIWDT